MTTNESPSLPSSTRIYSNEENSTLPTNDTDLTSTFSQSDYNAVAADDSNNVFQTSTNNYNIFLFKKKHTEKNSIFLTIRLKSDRAPFYSPVYLQIYNKNSSTWETLNNNHTEKANVNFTLTGTVISNSSNYFDNNYWISYRIYQESI